MVARKQTVHSATGRRKNAVARVHLSSGAGKVIINGREFNDYFPLETLRNLVQQPLRATNTTDKFDVKAIVAGGGPTGQAGALRHGIARALTLADQALRPALKSGGFLTRDPRMKERKKSGQPGARKRFQFSKR